MPNIKSSKKRMELSRKANERNRARRSRLRTAIKKVREAQDAETANARFAEAVVLLDRAAQRRLYHPNKTARIKSALQKHVSSLAG